MEPALAIELSSTGIARSRVCAPPHLHINSQGSRPSLCGVHNVEVLGASGTKKSVTAAAIGPKWPAAAVLSLWVLVTPVLYGPRLLGSSTTDSGFELGTDIRSGEPDVQLPPFCFTTQKPPCVIPHHSMSQHSGP